MAPWVGSAGAALALGILLVASGLFVLFIAPRPPLWMLFGLALALAGFLIARRAESRAARLAGFLLPIAGLGFAGLSLGWLIGLYDLRVWRDYLLLNPVGFALAALGVLGAAAFIREGAQLLLDRQWRAGTISLSIGVLGLLLLGGAVVGVLLRSVALMTLLVVGAAIVAVIVTSAASIFVQPSSVAAAAGPRLPGEVPLPSGGSARWRQGALPTPAAPSSSHADPLASALRRPDHVTELDLAGRGLTALSPEIGRLRHLRSLDLGEKLGPDDTVLSNHLRSLPATVGALRQLETLNLAANALDSLPEEFAWLERLRRLDLSFNRLRELPPALRSLRSLETLRLERNRLEALPPWLGELRALRTLVLADNRIAALPDTIGALGALRTLDLSHNQLTALPETLGELEHLESLSLYANQIRELPRSFGALRALRMVALGGNPLDLERVLALLAQLPALETLDLRSVGASVLPATIGRFPALRTLILRGNALQTLPDTLANLTTLEGLDLAHNQFREVPAVTRRLPLRRLDLDGNPLVVH
ncbi:MAG: leucine-rich repeat domain-containing protein [Chloroflexota bacterium]|nr:leucine-rich repeat domain-containing protein [Dehalococcoidia bacterium]MDW8252472.1 leucine-rich repeat domain-containing protein [Chloroflexota bacterium]